MMFAYFFIATPEYKILFPFSISRHRLLWEVEKGNNIGTFGFEKLLVFTHKNTDSATGRFISRDPVKAVGPQEINPYQYALANPLRFVDVTGKISLDESAFRLTLELKDDPEFKKQIYKLAFGLQNLDALVLQDALAADEARFAADEVSIAANEALAKLPIQEAVPEAYRFLTSRSLAPV